MQSYTASKINNHSKRQSAGKNVTAPKGEGEGGRMFDLFDSKAEVEILNSVEDDNLAAAMYGGVKKSKKKKSKKTKKGVSGYNFDRIIKDESSSSSNSDFHESFAKYS